MRLRNACLAAAAVAVVGLAATAQAKPQPQNHVITIRLPFGGTETVRYAGDTAPTITWSDAAPLPTFDPFIGVADFDRIFATMDRQMADFDRQMAALERNAANTSEDGLYDTAVGGGKGGLCAETVEMTQTGNQAPRVVRRTFGACAAPNAQTATPTMGLTSASEATGVRRLVLGAALPLAHCKLVLIAAQIC